MSQESAAERTEEPTPKRLQDARQKGEVARSKELDTACSLAAGAAGLAVLGPSAARRMREALAELWTIDRAEATDPGRLVPVFLDAVLDAVLTLAPFMALMFASSFIGPALMGGFLFAAPRFDPKRLDPAKGIGRMVSTHALGELVKAIAKVLLFVAAVWAVLQLELRALVGLGRVPLGRATAEAFDIVFWLILALAAVMVLIAAADVPWQMHQHAKKLRMTLEEVKRERRETEGSPETKSRQRGEQMRASRGRMIQAVPGASVVITNPTHYAVALRYGAEDREPVVVAKGVDELALRIRAVAVESGVRTFEAPPLARALFRHVRVGEPVRPELWHAVAQVLAFVIRLDAAVARGRGAGPRTPWPVPPGASELEVPPELGDGAP